jgi:threonine/homoserine efflux transporter RhtA
MRRLFWIALGATLGVLIFRKLARAAEKLTPQGIASSLGAGLNELAYALRDFADDVREAMSAQESALRAAAGLDSGDAQHPLAGPSPDPSAQTAG